MGTYILFTINHKIIVQKKDLSVENITFEEMLNGLNLKFQMSHYQMIEQNNHYEFQAKESVFNSEQLLKFLKEQYSFFTVEKQHKEEIFQELSKASNYNEMIQLVEKCSYPCFQSDTTYENIRCGGWKRFRITLEGIVFFIEGKAYLECYEELFTYIESLIKKTSQYEISQLVKVVLTL